jgi:hypothetical protein
VSGLVEEGLPRSSLHKSTAWFCISKSHPGVILRVIRGSQIGPLWIHTATFMCDPHGEHSPNEAIDSIPELPRLVPKNVGTAASVHAEGVSTRDFAPTKSQTRASDDDDKHSIVSSDGPCTVICDGPITSVTDHIGFTPVEDIDLLGSLEKETL